MTSYYNQIPTLTMRARAAILIVVGRINKTLRDDIELHEGKRYLRSTYEVQVERVLKAGSRANADERTIAVQMLCGEVTHDVAPKPCVAPEDGPLVLMLSEGMVPGTYVPYLGSVFPVSAEGQLQLGEHAAEKIGLPGATQADERGVTLDAVARLIEEVVREEADAGRDAVAAPLPVTELPVGHEGGGRDAQPAVLRASENGPAGEAASA